MMRLTPKLIIGSSILAASSSTRQTTCILPRIGVYKWSHSLPDSHPSIRDTVTSMKAVRVDKFGDESNLKLVTESLPFPKSNEVLVKVEAIGVNPVEVMIRNGLFGNMIKVPYVPGTDVAGTVEEVGSGVSGFKQGDRVYTMKTSSGAYAQYCTAPVDSVSKLHRRLSFSQGAALGLPFTVAYKALFIRAQSQKGETVFVHGASGAVGLAAVQMAKANNMRVIGSASTQEGMALVKSQGADVVVNHSEKGYMEKVKEAAGSQGVNVILEMLANKNLVEDLQLVARRGRIVVIGNKGAIDSFDPSLVMGAEASILGLVAQTSTPEEYREIMNALDKGQASWVNPPIAREYSLEEVATAHRDIAKGSDSKGKLIINPTLERQSSEVKK